MGISQGCVKIHCDSQSAIHLANHQVYHERTKHIDIRFHFVRDMIETKEIMVEKVASEENPADMFTKSLLTLVQIRDTKPIFLRFKTCFLPGLYHPVL